MLALLTGGAASGKSELAERAALSLNPGPGPVAYVATMLARGGDTQRIARHRARRGPEFVTVERAFDLEALTLPQGTGCALLECLGTLLANERYERGLDFQQAQRACREGVRHLAQQVDHLVVVGNDLFRDGGDYDGETRAYVAALGRLTAALGAQADLLAEAVCGLPVIHKGEELWARCGV